MSGEYALPVLLQQELSRTEADLAVAVTEAQRARREAERMFRRLSDQEKYNIASRRSLCEQSDRYLAERNAANDTIRRVELLKVWTNEDGKRFVFADDLFAALYPERQQ